MEAKAIQMGHGRAQDIESATGGGFQIVLFSKLLLCCFVLLGIRFNLCIQIPVPFFWDVPFGCNTTILLAKTTSPEGGSDPCCAALQQSISQLGVSFRTPRDILWKDVSDLGRMGGLGIKV